MVLVKSDSVRLIRDIYADRQSVDRPVISIEFFTPKTSKGDKVLCESTLPALSRLSVEKSGILEARKKP